jgi:hypothetical protein
MSASSSVGSVADNNNNNNNNHHASSSSPSSTITTGHRVEEVPVNADGDWLTPLVNTWNEVASYIPESVKSSIAASLPAGASDVGKGEKDKAALASGAAGDSGAAARTKDLVLAVSFDVR